MRPVSHCESRWGTCMRDPRCNDMACPAHPATTCSLCAGGKCKTPQACMQPLQEMPQRIERNLFSTRRNWRQDLQRAALLAALLLVGFLFFYHR